MFLEIDPYQQLTACCFDFDHSFFLSKGQYYNAGVNILNDRLLLVMGYYSDITTFTLVRDPTLLIPLIISSNFWICTLNWHPLIPGLPTLLPGTDSDLSHHDASELSGHSLADQLNTR